MEACSGGSSSSGGSSAVPAAQSSFSLLSRSSSSFALSFPFLLPADCCAIRHPLVFNALVNGSSQWLVVVLELRNSTDDLGKSGRRSSYMTSLFITVIFLLLARGFLPTERSSSQQTLDDDNHNHGNDGNRPPSKSPVAIAFGGRCRHILLSSLRWLLPSAFLPPLLSSDAELSSLTSCSSFSSSLLLV